MARRILSRWLVGLVTIGLFGCSAWVSAARAADPVIAASGDISCGLNSINAACHQAQTAHLLASIHPLNAVLPLGDVQYECGELSNFSNFYNSTWGRFKSITHPAIGNHEYQVSGPDSDCLSQGPGAPGYFTYFGSSIASPLDPGCTSSCKGYYSYNLGTWHLIALNSNCSRPGVGGCGAGSPQYNWLKNDLGLAGGTANCILAYWHQPRYSSGGRQGSQTQSLWELLYDAGADIVLTGHDHVYERFAKLGRGTSAAVDPVADPDGIREWVVGLGGRNITSWSTIRANSEARDRSAFGVLKLTLHDNSYAWRFLPEARKTFTDSGSSACNGPPVVGPSTLPPDNRFRISHIRVHRNGVVQFDITVHAPGRIDVLETARNSDEGEAASVLLQPAAGRFAFARAHLTARRARTIHVKVRPNPRGKRLVKHHRHTLRIRLWVTFQPNGGHLRKIGFHGLFVTK